MGKVFFNVAGLTCYKYDYPIKVVLFILYYDRLTVEEVKDLTAKPGAMKLVNDR